MTTIRTVGHGRVGADELGELLRGADFGVRNEQLRHDPTPEARRSGDHVVYDVGLAPPLFGGEV